MSRGQAMSNGRSAIVNLSGSNAGHASFFENRLSDSEPELLTVTQAAQFLTVSVPTVRRLQAQRNIPFVKVGGSVRFDKRDLVAYVERCRVESIG